LTNDERRHTPIAFILHPAAGKGCLAAMQLIGERGGYE
jgi:hypothetical protein